MAEGLQGLIEKFQNKENNLIEKHTLRKIGKHKKRAGHEMRLNAHIGEYKMDQVILDLGSDANIVPK